MWAVKSAILALYIRLFGTIRWIRLTSYGLIIFMFLFYGSNVVIAATYCLPRNGAPWDTTALARCSSPVASVVVIGAFGVVADLILFALPFPIIYQLQLTRQKRISLTILFLVGFLYVPSSSN